MSFPTSYCQPLLNNRYEDDVGIINIALNLPLNEINNISTFVATPPYESPPYSNSSPQTYGNISPYGQENTSPFGNTIESLSPHYARTSPSYTDASSPFSENTDNQLLSEIFKDQKPLREDLSFVSNYGSTDAQLPCDLQTTQVGGNDDIFRMSNSQYNDSSILATNQFSTNFPLLLEYKKFPSKLFKVQKRAHGQSQQRIENAELQFILDFQDVVTTQLIKSIQVFVKRTNEVRNTPQFVGAVMLTPKFDLLQNSKCLVTVDLDSVYEAYGKKVYRLQKTLTDELNTFHLNICVSLQDGRKKTLRTKEILFVGKKTQVGEKRMRTKAPRKSSPNSDDLIEPLCKAASLSPDYNSPVEDEDVFRASKIVANHIQTKSLEVDGILVKNIIQTPNGDIAYHFPLNNPTETFNEGEVVGLIHSDVNSGLKIVKLTAENASHAILKGVITRSQYLEAMKPYDRTVTETICMMGVVPVKVQDSVQVNEPLYASLDLPGVATSGFNLSFDQISDASLVGYAFQSFDAENELEIGLIRAGVSVLSSASQSLLSKRIRDMERKWNAKVLSLKKSNRLFRRCFLSCGIFTSIFLLLLGMFLWQLLLPGSAYRYYVCKIDSIGGHTSDFQYDPGHQTFNKLEVKGIEFTYVKLMKKINHDYPRINITGARYYLNVDLCAYGGWRSTRDETTGQIRVGGPIFYAVDGQCRNVYSIFAGANQWRDYSEIAWPDMQNITVKCAP